MKKLWESVTHLIGSFFRDSRISLWTGGIIAYLTTDARKQALFLVAFGVYDVIWGELLKIVMIKRR